MAKYNPRRAWAYMALYWLIGACVGHVGGYFGRLGVRTAYNGAVTWCHAVAFIVTFTCQVLFQRRMDSFARPRNVWAVGVFAVFNGIFETLLFLATYDFGRYALANLLFRLGDDSTLSWLGTTLARLLGFVVFCIYSAIIHANFWLPHGFPEHIAHDAAPFVSHGLPLLTATSASWLTLYELYGDVTTVCLLHGMIDAMGAWTFCLPGPMGRTKTGKDQHRPHDE